MEPLRKREQNVDREQIEEEGEERREEKGLG